MHEHELRHYLATYFCLRLARIAEEESEAFEAEQYLTFARQHEEMRWLHRTHGS
jgi:hypothetical protein